MLTGRTDNHAIIRTSSDLLHFLFWKCQHTISIRCYGSYNPLDYTEWFRRKGQYFGRWLYLSLWEKRTFEHESKCVWLYDYWYGAVWTYRWMGM